MKTTHVALVLDRSGSMSSVVDETISGFNEQLDTLRDSANSEHRVLVTTVLFANKAEVLESGVNVYDVKKLNSNTYVPSGLTAMYDGVGLAIEELSRKELGREDAVLVVIVSDGMENSSKEYTSEIIAGKIKRRQATEKWTFSYLGANQDLTKVQKDLGLHIGNTMSYVSTSIGTAHAFSQNSTATRNYMSVRGAGGMSVMDFYEVEKVEPTS
jgi:uncharacterized protein YegL